MQTTKTSRVSALLPTTLVEEIKKYSNSKKITQSRVIQNALEAWIRMKLNQDTKDLAGKHLIRYSMKKQVLHFNVECTISCVVKDSLKML